MNTTGITEMEAIYEAALKVLGRLLEGKALEPEKLEEVFAASFLAYGPSENERYRSLEEVRLLLEKTGGRGPASNGNKNFIPVFRSFSPDHQAAVYVDELHISPGGGAMDLSLRISLILFKLEEGWRIAHLHLSEPGPGRRQAEPQVKDSAVLEKQVKQLSDSLQEARETISANQAQLMRQEKLASLGQLTAGIAHEIKNPLNFITNFSELSLEYLDEIEENVRKLKQDEVSEEILALLSDVKGNLEKIHRHGSRADSIVKSMLLHSRGGSEKMENTDLNALIREYVNLAFHGMRANKNPINVGLHIETEEALQPVKLNAENFSRVILNLCKNAFDAMREKLELEKDASYQPKLSARTRTEGDKVIVEIEDNGPGIPEHIRDKIMLPFFTTKMGSDGTGLGLSISQEIIEKHGGELRISTGKEGTRFTIELLKN